jgi:mannitol/fructose-specific phosphotransferase system IIA component (Ntr-type)
MKICRYIRPEYIFLNQVLSAKDDVLRFIAEAAVATGLVKNGQFIYEGLKDRESAMTTGTGGGLGFPHTTSSEIQDAAVFLIRPATPLDFDAIDQLPVDIVLALLIPEINRALHIQILAGVSRLCREKIFLEAVRQADNAHTLWNRMNAIEEQIAFH